MAKTVLLGKDKEKQLKEQKKIAKAKNKKKRRGLNELKKVTWPGKKDLISATLAVIAFILVMAIVTGLFDCGLGELFSLVIS